MKIEKILNNNVVIINENGIEKIVMGRGLAFHKRPGDMFDEKMVDKVFTLTNQKAATKFQELIVDIPIEHIVLAEEIISYAKMQISKPLNEMVYISLVDHIYTSICRFLDGIVVKNALLWETRRFYPEQFAIGMKALDMIEERFKVRLPDDEAGFIALHLANAAMDEQNMQNIYQITKVMQEIVNIVKYKFNVDFNEDSVYYYRFITHLKFFAQRLVTRKAYDDDSDNTLLNMVKKQYKNSFDCVEHISGFILKKYQYVLSDEEKLYLTIHIERIIYKTTT